VENSFLEPLNSAHSEEFNIRTRDGCANAAGINMNNTQSLTIIFWCFIVVITRRFSLRPQRPTRAGVFTISARLRAGLGLLSTLFPCAQSKKCERHYLYRFYATFSTRSATHTPLRPAPTTGGIQNCKDINTTTSSPPLLSPHPSVHSACPSTFLRSNFASRLAFCRDFYSMKCFGWHNFNFASDSATSSTSTQGELIKMC
jgi:hypothetical protein